MLEQDVSLTRSTYIGSVQTHVRSENCFVFHTEKYSVVLMSDIGGPIAFSSNEDPGSLILKRILDVNRIRTGEWNHQKPLGSAVLLLKEFDEPMQSGN